MTPEQNLDEDILQCRAEIQRALRQDPVQDEKSSTIDNGSQEPSDTLPTEDLPDSAEFLIRDPDPQEEEEQFEDLIEDQTDSNTGSFTDLSSEQQDPQEKNTAAERVAPETAHPSAEPKKLFFPKDLDQYNKILKALKDQKENLSQTCDQQEKHILDLTEQVRRLEIQSQQAEKKAADLADRVRRLSEDMETSGKLREELDQARSETDKLRRELAAIQRWHQETIKEKNQQTEQNKAQSQQMQSIETARQALQQEMDSIKKKNDDLIKTIASLNQENEHLRQEKTSLQQQVFSLQEGLSHQQMESQKAVAVLRDELAGKTDLLDQQQAQLDRITEELRSAQDRIQSLEQALSRSSPAASEIEVYFPTEAQSKPHEEPAVSWIPPEPAEPAIPRFDLSDQILSLQRRQSSGRRQPPSAGRTSPTDNVRKVVQQFVTAPSEVRDIKPPVRQPAAPAPAPETEYHCPPRRPAEERPPLIAQIVQRDIETFCKQNQWLFIEFPSG
jgi:myosin protein heavy chain